MRAWLKNITTATITYENYKHNKRQIAPASYGFTSSIDSSANISQVMKEVCNNYKVSKYADYVGWDLLKKENSSFH